MAPWLNWIEQPPPKGQVAGSNPAGVATIFTSNPKKRAPKDPHFDSLKPVCLSDNQLLHLKRFMFQCAESVIHDIADRDHADQTG